MDNNYSKPRFKQPNDGNGYKIRCNERPYYVFKYEMANGIVKYRMPVTRKDYDGNYINAYRLVEFKSREKECKNLPDKFRIIPKCFYEDFYYKKDDTMHSNPQWKLVMLDWEMVEADSKEVEMQKDGEAFLEYGTRNDDIDWSTPF